MLELTKRTQFLPLFQWKSWCFWLNWYWKVFPTVFFSTKGRNHGSQRFPSRLLLFIHQGLLFHFAGYHTLFPTFFHYARNRCWDPCTYLVERNPLHFVVRYGLQSQEPLTESTLLITILGYCENVYPIMYSLTDNFLKIYKLYAYLGNISSNFHFKNLHCGSYIWKGCL